MPLVWVVPIAYFRINATFRSLEAQTFGLNTLSDFDLPDMSGFEVLIKLVPFVRFPDLPVVVLTRFTEPRLA